MKRSLAVAALLIVALAAGASVAAAGEPADITVIQPDYVDGSVGVETVDGDRVYRVEGPQQHLSLDGVNHDNVSHFGVEDGAGSLEYDANTDQYRFEPDGDGTTTLFWVVQDSTGETRYTAVVSAENTDWVHRTTSEDEDLREDADRFRDIERQVHRYFPDRDTDDVIGAALTKERFFESPFATFFADMRAVLLTIALRPGGWVVGGFFLLISLFGVAYGARYRNRTQKQFRDLGDLELEKNEAYIEKAKRILSNKDYNDFSPDDTARALREKMGRNCWLGLKKYMQLRTPTSVKGTVLQMMAQDGYVGHYREDATGDITTAWVTREPDVQTDGGDVETLDLADIDPEADSDIEFINALPGEELDLGVFSKDIDIGEVSFPISNREVDDADLLEELNPHFPDDFEDEEHLAEALAKLMETVVNHPHTDSWGRPRPEMDLLSFLAEMDSVLADEADFPVGHVMRRELVYIAENLDKTDEVNETIDRLDEEGVA